MSDNTSSKRSREPSFRGRPVPDDQRDHALGFHWRSDLHRLQQPRIASASVARPFSCVLEHSRDRFYERRVSRRGQLRKQRHRRITRHRRHRLKRVYRFGRLHRSMNFPRQARAYAARHSIARKDHEHHDHHAASTLDVTMRAGPFTTVRRMSQLRLRGRRRSVSLRRMRKRSPT
jgi:hypothetical protein